MWIGDNQCFECGYKGAELHHHHVVPRSRSGTQTVPLCGVCHAHAHHMNKNMTTSALVKESIRRRKEENPDLKWGNQNLYTEQGTKAIAVRQSNAREFNSHIKTVVEKLKNEGYGTLETQVSRLNELNFRSRRGETFNYHSLYRILYRTD